MNVKLSAEARYDSGTQVVYYDRPSSFSMTVECDSESQAAQVGARFPKGAKVSVGTCSSWASGEKVTWHQVRFQVSLAANKVNGGVNEAGVKRARQVLATLAKQGWLDSATWKAGYVNSYPSLADFQAAAGV